VRSEKGRPVESLVVVAQKLVEPASSGSRA
jgi:hypothetical protein